MADASPDAEVTLAEGLATTRSIRRYTDEPVSEADLAKILYLATRAPSGSNRQPTRFVVLRDSPVARTAREVLSDGAREMWAQKSNRGEFLAIDTDSPTGRMIRTMDDYVGSFAEVPIVVLICLERYRAPVVSEGASVYPAVQNLLLGARSCGLGAALTMFHRQREPELRELLAIPDHVLVAATVTIGHPRGRHGPVRRKPLGDVVFEGYWGARAEWAIDPSGTRFTGGPAGPRGARNPT